ncbi:hypothetical protein [Paenibacillus pabuli]|nr:hypothetical protein [Paenibacillus pabuli]UPK47682.1 hypothetical protein KET34_28360 [Paenibacillus pabuli]
MQEWSANFIQSRKANPADASVKGKWGAQEHEPKREQKLAKDGVVQAYV